jgi:CheY-like chemotaxis protein
VLVAEDNRVNQILARRLLERRGFAVSIVDNGRACVEAVERKQFDLVFMDVQMPEMDGFTATSEIRALEQRTGRHVPIIAMTAFAQKEDEERCLAAGMDGYVSKPISTERLDAVIGGLYRQAPGCTDSVPANDSGRTDAYEKALLPLT